MFCKVRTWVYTIGLAKEVFVDSSVLMLASLVFLTVS